MKIEAVAQDEVHITCECGYDEYMAPSCRCCPDKIRRRARRAFDGATVHRVTEVTEKSLLYRLPHEEGQRGKKIKIRRDVLGRIYVPHG